jgi:outer membrane lipoprotein SlyB
MWMAALCAVALAGCADRWDSNKDDNSGYTSRSSSSAPMSSGGSGGTSSSAMATDTTGPTQATYGMVQAIDPMQRQDLGLGAVGAAAVGGTSGTSGAPGAPVYRVTVRMDDGSSQTIVVDAMPAYKVGDRVRYNNGAISPY